MKNTDNCTQLGESYINFDDLKNNLLPILGFLILGALSIWFIESFTSWFEGLSFNPWWLMAPVVVVCIMVVIIANYFWYEWDIDETFEPVIYTAFLLILVTGNLGFALWFRGWLDSLPFSPWWLLILVVPIAIMTLWLVVRIGPGIELDIDNFFVANGITILSLILLAANIQIALWLNPWLESLPFNPWWVLVPVSVVSLVIVLLSGWWWSSDLGELLINLPLYLALVMLVPLITAISPLLVLVWEIYSLVDRLDGAEREGGESKTGELWTDRAISNAGDDRFGFQDYATVLTDRILQAKTPLTIGIFGRWGTGKTSLMKLIESELNQETENYSNFKTLSINVWRLSNRKELWNAFLQSLLTRVYEKLPWYRRPSYNLHLFSKRIKWVGVFHSLAINSYRIVITIIPILLSLIWLEKTPNSTDDILNFALNPIIGGGGSLVLGLWLLVRPAVQAARDEVSLNLENMLKQAPYNVQISALQHLQGEFEDLVKFWVGENGKLVVFVDDLDRCSPDKIPEILEALKLFTSTEGCIYVFGIDYDVVRNAVKKKYNSSPDEAADYLEKIIQIPFHLSLLEPYRISDFVKHEYPKVCKFCSNAPEIFSSGLEPNPRKVKRALNIYRTVCHLANKRYDDWEMDHKTEPDLMAKMVVIQSRFRKLYREVERDPDIILRIEKWANDLSDEGLRDDIGKDIPKELEKSQVPKHGLTALAKMMTVGEKRFKYLNSLDLRAYIFLTGTAEDGVVRVRPSRKERDELLDGTPQELVKEILEREKNQVKQKEITRAYIDRLNGVIKHAKDDKVLRFSREEILSANIALDILEDVKRLEEVEPHTVRIPGGVFLMGYTNEDVKIIKRQLNIDTYTENIDEQTEGSMLKEFTQRFVTDLQEEIKKLDREIVESDTLGNIGFGQSLELINRPRKKYRDEKKEKTRMSREVEIRGDFFISRYPVTNLEYSKFEQSHNTSMNLEHHPVVNVSWKDAENYCKWLSEETGKKYRLPNEDEWEKAARGVSGQVFPRDNCNTIESGKNETVNVEYYSPKGDSPYSVADMIGNVWEWTNSPCNTQDGENDVSEYRVLKGGSFIDYLEIVCCPVHHCADPNLKLKNVGFRVVSEP